MRNLWILLTAIACSQPHAPRASSTTATPEIAPVPARAVPRPPPEVTRAAGEEESADAGELEPTLERATVRGDGLEVAVSWWTLTGTTHVADELLFTSSSGTLRLTGAADDEQSEALPLIERVHAAGVNRWVALGWSSSGSGMQTEHAWLIDGGRTPRVVDKLEWTTDRRHAGLAIEVSRKIEIGIPLPQRPTPHVDSDDGDDDHDEQSLHDADGWMLVHGKTSYTLATISKLPSHRVDLASLGGFYTPPFQDTPSERGWSGAFVWFSAEKQFALQKL